MSSRILIMEDDPFAQELYRFLFQRKGYDFIITDDGDQFVDIIENQQIALVILDVNLKNTFLNDAKVDGIYLSRQLKLNDKHKHIPVIIVTAYYNSNGKDFMRESLADEFVAKPIIDFDDLIKKINNLIVVNG
jgi:CheY-like chemotaxis protein